MKQDKYKPPKNPVARWMLRFSQKTSAFTDQKKKQDKEFAKQPIEDEEIDPPFHEREIDDPDEPKWRKEGRDSSLEELLEESKEEKPLTSKIEELLEK